MAITVYTKPSCVQCTATFRAMDKLGLDYQVVDLAEDEQALLDLMARGHRSAPVVEADGQWWAGFRPDLIRGLAPRAA